MIMRPQDVRRYGTRRLLNRKSHEDHRTQKRTLTFRSVGFNDADASGMIWKDWKGTSGLVVAPLGVGAIHPPPPAMATMTAAPEFFKADLRLKPKLHILAGRVMHNSILMHHGNASIETLFIGRFWVVVLRWIQSCAQYCCTQQVWTLCHFVVSQRWLLDICIGGIAKNVSDDDVPIVLLWVTAFNYSYCTYDSLRKTSSQYHSAHLFYQ